ncbi:MAG: 2-C-methyl-D-erythritol 4-phosphate cytidylyltransferase [Acidimicrobiia bacterium]|nr:2-C-methyl-D-erythritol 4-phosphate cytidylyltransferase [Acidimicrobiia bacterium]MYB11591.1 2-C-methyl-D-erythritol 4-phosphate cytidylyltransferase [Acidimicrobiia bacterium]MYE74022.1 2-C-methyl-D-erythritol 4-phosphate cytidylyltransferase [Acidimicrobiia bacterium]MYG58651.1 2-C-methyl-D-erythritol 4-phosphate cytidylyltransferase [Acidimicrobiia bacterium]MYJ32858.1 2-C-methyl-D-erythritol 4-phosphate cytidylyltransferase [Acidimicrobiia bacterium]
MATDPSVWTVVVAAGSGTRFGGAKQYLELAGSRIVDRSVAVAAQVSDGVVVVVPAEDVEAESARLAADSVVAGGPSRAASVRNGLAAVPHEADVICVHDAARPLASPEIYERVVQEVDSGAAGAVPVVPVTDTIRSVDGGVVDRNALQAVQTPQAFRAELLRMAHADAADATDDASLVEAAGYAVVAVDGHPRNIKITHPDDLAAAEAWLAT